MGVYLSGTGQTVHVHNPHDCGNHRAFQRVPCVIHHPTEHSMRGMPTHWDGRRHMMGRICEHKVWHPDPDDMNFQLFEQAGVHDCCVAWCCGTGPAVVSADDTDV
jgi:hypothetical protein